MISAPWLVVTDENAWILEFRWNYIKIVPFSFVNIISLFKDGSSRMNIDIFGIMSSV